MLFHGYDKLMHGIDGIIGIFQEKDLPGFLAFAVYLGGLVAPLFLIAVYRTKIASLFIAVTMVVAIILVHSTDILKLGEYGNWALELIGLYLFGSISIFFLGGGKIALSSSNKWD